ncbi:MAG: hypothetical protein ACXWP0_01275 [Ktedonobacterales bacterium]
MTIEEMGRKIIADSIKDFNARLHAARTIEERAAILRVPVWVAQAQEGQERELDEQWAALDAADEEQDATDDMDWRAMAEMFEEC